MIGRLLVWVGRHRVTLLVIGAAITVTYGALIIAFPGHFARTLGYVIGSVSMLMLFVIDIAWWRERTGRQ